MKLNRYKMNIHPCEGLFSSVLASRILGFCGLLRMDCADAGIVEANTAGFMGWFWAFARNCTYKSQLGIEILG